MRLNLADQAAATDLLRVIKDRQPGSVLLTADKSSLSRLRSIFSVTNCETYTLATVATHDMGIAWRVTQHWPEQSVDHCLAQWRDRLCQTVFLYEYGEKNMTPELEFCRHLRALGFQLIKTYRDSKGNGALFYFDIYDYKRVPSWLNSRFWAHPERWNKARW